MNKPTLGGLVTVFAIFAASALLGGQSISLEVWLQIGVAVAIGAIVIGILIHDYKPILEARMAAAQFEQQRDVTAYQKALDRFKTHNHLPDYENMMHLMQADLDIYAGQLSSAVDDLLYVDLKRIKDEDHLDWALLRCRALMFLDQLRPDETAWAYITGHTDQLGAAGRFTAGLASCYLCLSQGDEDGYRKHRARLTGLIKAENPRSDLMASEAAWLDYLHAARGRSHKAAIECRNLLAASQPPAYVAASWHRHEDQNGKA